MTFHKNFVEGRVKKIQKRPSQFLISGLIRNFHFRLILSKMNFVLQCKKMSGNLHRAVTDLSILYAP